MNSSINWICSECGYSTSKVWPHCKRCLAPNPETDDSTWETAPVEIIPVTELALHFDVRDERRWMDLSQ